VFSVSNGGAKPINSSKALIAALTPALRLDIIFGTSELFCASIKPHSISKALAMIPFKKPKSVRPLAPLSRKL
jgi:hypothetical protein